MQTGCPGNTGTGAPNPALHISAPSVCWLLYKGHASTTWNSLSELPGYPTEGLSVLLWSLPCSTKETCGWELSDLEPAPPAGADSKETVSWFRRCDSLRHLSSYLPVSCRTRKSFHGAERNTFCLLSQDSKAWTVTKTGNRKPKLRIQLNKSARLEQCWESPAFITAGLRAAQHCGQSEHSSSRKWPCREQPASQTQHNPDRTVHRSREDARVGQMKSYKEEARNTFVKEPKGLQGDVGFF